MLYEIEDRVYISLTNRCPVSCSFCVKKPWEMNFRGHDLRLTREPEAEEVIAALTERLKRGGVREAVFCGYGECVYRLDAVSAVGLHLRLHHKEVKVRLNTIGLGNLIWKRDISRLLALSLDAVSVSLNTADEEQWEKLHRPEPEYRGLGFSAAKDFIFRCSAAGLATRVTAVALPGVDLQAVGRLAAGLGAGFEIRPRLS